VRKASSRARKRRTGKSKPDGPADDDVARDEQETRQLDANETDVLEDGRDDHRHEHRAGRHAQARDDETREEDEREEDHERKRKSRVEPRRALRRSAREPGGTPDDRRRASRNDDAEVLHERDETHVSTERVGEHHHDGRPAREHPPHGGAPRQEPRSRERETRHRPDEDDGERRAGEEASVCEHRVEERGREVLRHQAADDRLRERKCRLGQAQRCATGGHDHRRGHRAEQECSRQMDQTERRYEDGGQRRKRAVIGEIPAPWHETKWEDTSRGARTCQLGMVRDVP
jgi:hypothetical protein